MKKNPESNSARNPLTKKMQSNFQLCTRTKELLDKVSKEMDLNRNDIVEASLVQFLYNSPRNRNKIVACMLKYYQFLYEFEIGKRSTT